MLNQLTEEINPAGERTSYTYDVLGNLTGVTDANGNTETYGYNALSLPVIHTDKMVMTRCLLTMPFRDLQK